MDPDSSRSPHKQLLLQQLSGATEMQRSLDELERQTWCFCGPELPGVRGLSWVGRAEGQSLEWSITQELRAEHSDRGRAVTGVSAEGDRAKMSLHRGFKGRGEEICPAQQQGRPLLCSLLHRLPSSHSKSWGWPKPPEPHKVPALIKDLKPCPSPSATDWKAAGPGAREWEFLILA